MEKLSLFPDSYWTHYETIETRWEIKMSTLFTGLLFLDLYNWGGERKHLQKNNLRGMAGQLSPIWSQEPCSSHANMKRATGVNFSDIFYLKNLPLTKPPFPSRVISAHNSKAGLSNKVPLCQEFWIFLYSVLPLRGSARFELVHSFFEPLSSPFIKKIGCTFGYIDMEALSQISWPQNT